MKVTVSVGPGPYSRDLISQLGSRGVLERVIHSWPEAVVHRWDAESRRLQRERSLPLYRPLVHATWSIWTRIPRLGRHQVPRSWINAAFDWWARGHLGHPDLFLGWAQISLRSLRAARQRGISAVLEHPMMHVDLWQETMTEEHARHAPRSESIYSLRPRSMVHRMKEEYQAADAIVVPSAAALDSFLVRGVQREQLVLVPFGVQAEVFSPRDSQRRDLPFRLLYVGRLELLKGIHYLLEAWASLPAGQAELWLVGPVLPEMKPILSRLARPDVKVVGEVSSQEVAQHYRQADALVFPSLCDGFGLVILEAMACGLPVVATSLTGGPDVIEEGQTGFVVPIRDAAALADRMAWLIAHRRELAEMGRAGRARILSDFTVDHYGARLVKAYEGILERDRSAEAPSSASPPGRGGSATSLNPK
jgi:glycosyltransferase involved in cell wall biosynthesis